MATSGTIGQTIISTAKVLEHALRRAGVPASLQTPETVDIAKECLYLLLTHYANTGLNLWCIEKTLKGYIPGKKDYHLPTTTSDLLNVLHCNPTLASSTLAGNITTLSSLSTITRVGVRFSTLPTADYNILASRDGVGYVTVATGKLLDLTTDPLQVYWFDLDPVQPCLKLQVSGGVVDEFYSATSVSELPMTILNRDSYATLPNKDISSPTSTNFLFNKTLNPYITIWPVPVDDFHHMAQWIHRQVQDVGSLTQTLAIPQRWFEATIIQLAFRLSMELPGVDPARIKMLLDLSTKFQIEAGTEESDSAPVYIQPNIGVYTK